MVEVAEFDAVLARWQQAAAGAGPVARERPRALRELRAQAPDAPDEAQVEAETAELLAESERLLELVTREPEALDARGAALRANLAAGGAGGAGGDDGARIDHHGTLGHDSGRAYWVLAGTLQQAAVALDEANRIEGEVEVGPDGEPVGGDDEPVSDDAHFFAAAIRDPRAAAKRVPLPLPLDATLDEVSTAAGAALVTLTTSAAVGVAVTEVAGAAQAMLAGRLGQVFDDAREAVRGVAAALRRKALAIVAWVSERVAALLPQDARDAVDAWIQGVRDDPEATLGAVVGAAAAAALGRDRTVDAWQRAAAAGRDLTDATAALPDTVAPHLSQLGWTQKIVRIANLAAQTIAAVIAAAPALAILAGVLAAVGFVFVGSRLWDALRDVRALAA